MAITLQQGFSQFTQINGIINAYTPIETIYSADDNNVDSLIVGSVAAFDVGDTVMVYCVQGAKIATDTLIWGENIGRDAQEPRNTGKYAFLIIDEIDIPTRLVVLNSTVRPDINPMGEGEAAQLIRVPSYRKAEVTAAGISAPPWDGSTGGVVTMFVKGVLRLNGDIDVSGRGFWGAEENVNYGGDCSSVNPGLYDSAFYHIDNIRAGIKGEGTTDTRFDWLRGKVKNINGGGGGNALFSGGGGGSNFSGGGKGGNESSQCAPGVASPGGQGGFDLSRNGYYYINGNSLNRGNRIFLGGGGGTGTQMPGRTTTDGGDGGGLVVIVADTIIGNNNSIIADGGDVTAIATGAGGGGGGGGCIVLDVSGYQTVLNLSAVGGKGGDTNHATDTTGPGGGGGGGIYWMAGTTQPGVNTSLSNGITGKHLKVPPINYGAGDGGSPGKKDDLIAPLRGFLFNAVPVEFTVCADQLPGPIYASEPKGGGGPGTYSYQWVDSSSTQNFWDIAPGVSDQQSYTFPGALPDTTYFRRIVTSGPLPADTSFRIAVYVHPAITGNTVLAPDTVCQGNQPQLFNSSGTIGGGLGSGTYTYKWQKDEGPGTYEDADGPSPIDGPSYQAPGLDVTTHFARIAKSGVCADTSAPLTVKVWETLTGNNITPFDTICYNTQPDQIGGAIPGAGDPADKRYQWENAAVEAGPWTTIGGETSQYIQPPALTQTTWFRRVALSGNGDACVDVSAPVEVLNIPLVTGNTISGTQTVCTGDQAALLTGSDPGGGVQGVYSYQWQSRTQSTSWGPSTGINDIKTNYDAGIMDGDTTYFRRMVGSGGAARDVCLDPSESITIHVLPSITNNVITTNDAVKCQWEFLDDLTQDVSGGSTPGGGATEGGNDPTRIYKWEMATGQSTPGNWQLVSGANDIDYTDNPQLTTDEDRWYRRIVFSGPAQVCKDTATLTIEVHTQITGNTIEPSDSVCFDDTKLLLGNTPSGESEVVPVYTWRDLDSGSDIPGSDQEQLTTAPFNNLGNYHFERIVRIGECADTSNAMEVTVMQLPGGRLTDDAFTACEKDTVLAIDLNMDNLQIYLASWEVYLSDGVNPGEIGPIMATGDGDLAITLDIGSNDNIQHNYEISNIIYRSPEGRYACESPGDSISGTVPINVFRRPDPQIMVDGVARDSFKVCNTTVTLMAIPDNGTSIWTTDPSGTIFFTPGAGQDEYLVSIPNNHDDFGKYVLTFTSTAGDCYGEDIIDLHFFEQPAPAYAGNDTVLFLVNSVQLKADPATAGMGTWVLESGGGIIADEHDPNTFVHELALGEENEFQWEVTNGEDEGVCASTSDVTIVLRNEVKRYDGFSPNGDMDNEYFIMQGLPYADEFTVSFFNSLGNTVRTITNENVGELEIDPGLVTGGLREDEMIVWDGISNNDKPVPSGTYYYVVEYIANSVTYVFKGYVVVVRE